MNKLSKLSRKLLALLLVLAMVSGLIVPMANTAFAAPIDDYEALTYRMIAARDAILEAADTVGSFEIAPGYVLDLETEFRDFAARIDIDLGVAAALANIDVPTANRWEDPRLLNARNRRTEGTINPGNFNTFINDFGGNEQAAVKYLEQGGIFRHRFNGNGIPLISPHTLNWFISYGSVINASYSATYSITAGVGSASQSNALPAGTTLADVAEAYVDNTLSVVNRLVEEVNKLKAMADIDAIKAEMLLSACLDAGCTDDPCEDWAHRLMVSQSAWETAMNNYIADINRDLKIVGALATGQINTDVSLLSGNTNAHTYYNNTVAPSAVGKINAALSFLENGGYWKGTTGGNQITGLNIANQIYYKSRFTNYNVSFDGTPVFGSGFSDVEGQDEVLPLVEFHSDVLVMGATPGNLEMIYNMRVAQIQALINQAKALPTTVPAGGNLTQQEYEDAVAKFIADCERDLAIAAALKNGNLAAFQGDAAHWSPEDPYVFGDFSVGVDSAYSTSLNLYFFTLGGYGDTQDKRYANAIGYFRNGGYEYGFDTGQSYTVPTIIPYLGGLIIPRIDVKLQFKSEFHSAYSGGLFGIAANRENVIPIMDANLEALKKGNKYLTPFEEAKQRYEDLVEKLEAIQDNPGSIVTSNLDNNEDMEKLIDDIELIFSSYKDIMDLFDALESLVGLIGEDRVDDMLQSYGMSLETIFGFKAQMDSVVDQLEALGFDPTGEKSVRTSLEELLNNFDISGFEVSQIISGWGIPVVLDLAEYTALPGTTGAYNAAADMLETVYNNVMQSESIAGLLGAFLSYLPMDQINAVLEIARPILAEVRNIVDMLNSAIAMVYDIRELTEEVNGLIDDFNYYGLSKATAKLADAIDNLSDLLEALERSKLATWILDYLVNALDIDLSQVISGSLAGVANNLVNDWIGADLLNLNAEQLAVVGEFANGIIIDFVNNPAVIVPYLRIASDVIRRASGVSLGISYILAEDSLKAAGKLTSQDMINYGNYIIGLTTIVNAVGNRDILDAAQIQECVNRIVKTVACAKAINNWAKENLTAGNAKTFVKNATRYFALRIVDCIVNSEPYQMALKLEEQAIEAYGILCFLSSAQGQAIIAAQADVQGLLGLWDMALLEWADSEPAYESLFDGVHEYVQIVTAPTCAEDGYTTYTCLICNDSYVDDAKPALGHNYESTVTAPTCTEGGYTTHVCLNCGDSYVDDVLPTISHSYVADITAPTCIEGGYTTYACSVCGASYIDDVLPTISHSYVADVTAPTCIEGGYTTYTCSVCGDSYIGDILPTVSHSYIADVTAPTCTEDGYTTHTCAVCGDSYFDDAQPALGHSYDATVIASTCTTSGYTTYTCYVCGESYVDDVLSPLGHNYAGAVTEPTCTQDGYTEYTCYVCGDGYIDDVVPALGHDYVDVAVSPTEIVQGHVIKVCSRCDDTIIPTVYGVELNPTDIIFSNVDPGYGAQPARTATITNRGNTATDTLSITLGGANPGAFTLSKTSQTTLALGGSGTFTVAPKTGLAAGATYSATITVSSSKVPEQMIAVSFTVNANAYVVSLNPTDIFFETVNPGYGSQAAKTATIINVGNIATGALSITLGGTNPSAFTLSKSSQTSLAKGGTGTFTVAPKTGLTAGNTYTAEINVSNANVPTQTIYVDFTVNANVYSVSLSPTPEISFAAVNPGYSAPAAKTVTIANVGNVATGALNIKLGGANPNDFKLSKSSQTTLAVGKTGTFTVVPKTALAGGTYTATVIVSNGNTPEQTIEVSFTVNATVYGVSLNPTPEIPFATVNPGYSAPAAKTVTITNTGNVATGALNIKLGGTNYDAFKLSKTSQTTLAVGKTGTFTVVPKTALAGGTYMATVIVSNGNTPEQTIEVSFTVNDTVYGVSLDQNDMIFTAVNPGYSAPTAKTATITNVSNVASGALNITLGGTNPDAFKLSKTSQTTLAVGKTGTFTVVPRTGLAGGPYTATVTVSNANVPAQTFNVSFTVNDTVYGVSLSPTPGITFPDAKLRYGAQTTKTVTIANTGNVATGALNITLGGTDYDAFKLSKTSQTTLAVGKTGTFTVVPKTSLAVGTYTATVNVSNANTPVQTINVSFTVNP